MARYRCGVGNTLLASWLIYATIATAQLPIQRPQCSTQDQCGKYQCETCQTVKKCNGCPVVLDCTTIPCYQQTYGAIGPNCNCATRNNNFECILFLEVYQCKSCNTQNCTQANLCQCQEKVCTRRCGISAPTPTPTPTPSISQSISSSSSAPESLEGDFSDSPSIVLYEQLDFGGEFIRITSNTEVLDSTWQNRVSSIIVADGTWKLYSNNFYTGNSSVFLKGRYPGTQFKIGSLHLTTFIPTSPTSSPSAISPTTTPAAESNQQNSPPSPSSSLEASQSQSMSPSPSPSESHKPSLSPTSSPAPASMSPSLSPSQSMAPSISASSSSQPSSSPSLSSAASESVMPSQSPSTSSQESMNPSPSVSASESAMISPSQSMAASMSSYPTSSIPASISATPSQTASSSMDASSSPSESMIPSPSPSSSLQVSESPSSSMSMSPSESMRPSAQVSESPSSSLEPTTSPSSSPPETKLILFTEENFKGKRWEYSNDTWWIGWERNDQVQSVIILSGLWRLYKHSKYRNPYTLVGPGRYPTLKNSIGNNVLSSFKLEDNTATPTPSISAIPSSASSISPSSSVEASVPSTPSSSELVTRTPSISSTPSGIMQASESVAPSASMLVAISPSISTSSTQ